MAEVDAPAAGFELRSAALDAWSWHLLRCPTCSRVDSLCDVADNLVSLLGEQLAPGLDPAHFGAAVAGDLPADAVRNLS